MPGFEPFFAPICIYGRPTADGKTIVLPGSLNVETLPIPIYSNLDQMYGIQWIGQIDNLDVQTFAGVDALWAYGVVIPEFNPIDDSGDFVKTPFMKIKDGSGMWNYGEIDTLMAGGILEHLLLIGPDELSLP